MNNGEIDQKKRRFLVRATTLLTGVGAALTAIPFISAWLPSTKAKALGAPVECDISQIQPGQLLIVEWRGRPIWILRRTKEMIDRLASLAPELRDPTSTVDQQPIYAHNLYRSRNPEYLVVIGICTHLGCSPKYKPQPGEINPRWPGGFYCPCHGSLFDLAGRVFKGVPAPINLEVPPYTFIDDKTLLIGVDETHPR